MEDVHVKIQKEFNMDMVYIHSKEFNMDMVYILDQWIVVRIFYSLSCGIAEIFPSMPIKSSNVRW